MSNKAVYLTALKTLEFGEAPKPSAGAGEIVVRMRAVGICGSDLHYYSHGRIGDFAVAFPFVLGHECAGIVVEAGEGVEHLKPGDRVALEPGVPCGRCVQCLSGKYNLCPDVRFFATPPYDGCLMEYVVHPAQFAFKLPPSVSFEEGALVEPLAIGVNAARTGEVKLGDTVVVFGAGCIGLVSLLASRANGATRIIAVDVIRKRLEVARQWGAIPVNAAREDALARIAELTDGQGADVVLDCAGTNATLCQSVEAVGAGGTVVWIGMGSDAVNGLRLAPVVTKEATIKSLFRYRNLYPTTIAAIAEGRLDVNGLVSHRYSFDETPEAFARICEDAENIVKSVIHF